MARRLEVASNLRAILLDGLRFSRSENYLKTIPTESRMLFRTLPVNNGL